MRAIPKLRFSTAQKQIEFPHPYASPASIALTVHISGAASAEDCVEALFN